MKLVLVLIVIKESVKMRDSSEQAVKNLVPCKDVLPTPSQDGTSKAVRCYIKPPSVKILT